VSLLLRVLVEVVAHGRAAQNRLDELVLAEGFTKVVVHLRREALFAVANHGVCGERNDWGGGDDVVALPFADLGCGFEASLSWCQTSLQGKRGVAHHDGHLHIHENAIVSLLLNVLERLQAVVGHGHPVVVLL
jgi:hypothetical protein